MNGPSLKTQAKRFLVRRIAKAFGPTVTIAEVAGETGLTRPYVARVLREMRLPHADDRDGYHTENLYWGEASPVDLQIRVSTARYRVKSHAFD